jgi:hypothetical protein
MMMQGGSTSEKPESESSEAPTKVEAPPPTAYPVEGQPDMVDI